MSKQIVDLSEAFKERSVGDVPAPIDDVRFKRPTYAGADDERNDAAAERAAVVELIRKRMDVMRHEPTVVHELNWIVDFIEKGTHL